MEKARKFLLFLCALAIAFFLYADNVKAFTYVNTYSPSNLFLPTETSDILNLTGVWNYGYNWNNSSPWLNDFGIIQSVGNMNGIYLNIDADYYLGIEVSTIYEPFTIVSNFLDNPSRNPLTADNLRCGIGYLSYNGTYPQTVSNFSVVLEDADRTGGSYHHYRFHIRFNYSQQVAKFNGSENVSCFFQRPTDSYLFAQVINQNNYTEYFSYINRFNVTLSTDPNTEILEGISTQNNTIINQNNETNSKLQESINTEKSIDNAIKNDNVDGSTSQATSFFNNFQNNTYGLSDVVTMPLQLINQITSATCTDLQIPLPFVNQNVTLPCMYTIYNTYFGAFLTLYQNITFGIIAYYVCINIFRMVKNFKDPNNNEIEVMEL